ncbi:hypothetical protein H4R35_006314 [Dimargaris xerosporica]|nr:hypothetical protein H4R35_006314 [Dimargaris xerosporica]
MLKDGDLLANFKAIVKDVSTRQQGSHSVGSTVQAPAESNPLPPQTYREYMYRFWLEVICGNKLEKLRHYLGHLLAFQVIPGMIYQMLEFGWNAKALKLAAQVSHVQAFKWVVNLFTQNPPNYFEFIIMYALKRRPENFEDLIHAAYRDMGGEDDEKKAVIQTLYNCHKRFDSSHWEILGTMFGLTAHPDYSTYQYNTDVFCRSRLWKYVQDFELTNESYGAILTAKDVDISTLGIPEDG